MEGLGVTVGVTEGVGVCVGVTEGVAEGGMQATPGDIIRTFPFH